MLGGSVFSSGPLSYGAQARQSSPSSATIGIMSYIAACDRGRVPARTRKEQYRNTLMYAPWVLHVLTDRHVATHRLLAKMGSPTILATAESGPQYSLPSPATVLNPDQGCVGRSLAAAVSTLDALLYNASRGCGAQAFYTFGAGSNWSSHTA